MAKFMVKKSELKNICKAVDDRKLAELKKEIIEILKKQDEKDFKKAVDYLESQELHFTHLEKSFTGKWVEKAGYGIGTVRIWKGKKYKKIAPNKWARVFDKEGRGTNIAIGKLIARVQKIDNVEDLMAFVMANKQRFVDENGMDLPVLDKLRAAVDARNGNVGSRTARPFKNANKEDLEFIVEQYKKRPPTHEIARKQREQAVAELSAREKEKPSEKKSPEKLLKEMGFETMEKVSYNGDKWEVAGVTLDSDGNADGISLTPDRQSGNLKSSNVIVLDIDKIQKNKPADNKYKGVSEGELQKEVIKEFDNLPKENKAHGIDYYIEKIKNNNNQLYETINERFDDKARDFFIDAAVERMTRKENKKPAEKYDSKAYEEEKENILRHTNQDYNSVDEALVDLKRHIDFINRNIPSDETDAEKETRESKIKATEDIMNGLKDGDKALLKKFVKESEKPLKTTKSPFKVFADKKPVGTFEKYGDNAVVMDATKEQKALFDSLNKAVSKDPRRPFMTDCYYDGENIISTDGRRLVCIKVGNIGLDEGFVKVKTENGKVKIEKFEKDFGDSEVKLFPNYKRVMPDKNEQQVSLDSKRLKEKLKEMKKDGAYDKTGRVALEFKDGKVILDGTAVGQSDAKLDGFDFIMCNAEQLTDAIINNDGQTMFISDNPMKPVSISDGSSDIVIMPMNHDGNLPDYDENRAKKNAEREAKSEKKAAMKKKNQDYMADLIDRYKRSVPANFEERSIKNIQEWSTEQLERMYKVANADIDSLMEKKEFNSNAFSSFTNKNYDMSPERLIQQNYAMKEHPAIVRELERLIKERGGKIEKSLFDGFLLESLLEDEEDFDDEDESLFNDYSAEQPELFNSTEFKVREAMNRCKVL